MTAVMSREMAERGDDEDEDPLAVIERLVEQARRLEPLEDDVPPHDDPIEGLEARIERARRMAEGKGAKALRRLEDRIERAHWVPAPEPYQPPEGDPLEALEARARGEEPREATAPAGGEPSGGDASVAGRNGASAPAATTAPGDGQGGRHRRLGEALEGSLRRRDLPGPVRAEVAARLAGLVEETGDERLEALWELVVFGDEPE